TSAANSSPMSSPLPTGRLRTRSRHEPRSEMEIARRLRPGFHRWRNDRRLRWHVARAAFVFWFATKDHGRTDRAPLARGAAVKRRANGKDLADYRQNRRAIPGDSAQ